MIRDSINVSGTHDSFDKNYLLEDTEYTNTARKLERDSYIGQLRTRSIECTFCGREFPKTEERINKSEYHFCCDKHRLGWIRQRTGEDHPNWKGGKRSDRGPSWYKQREKAYERDGGECQHCGMKEDTHLKKHDRRADVHHIIPYRFYDDHEKANADSNLITLCATCHRKHERWANRVAESQGFK